MKQIVAVSLILGLALASTSAVAQSFEEKVSDMALLQSKEVQAELKITEETRAKLNVHAENFNKKANKLQQDYLKKAEGKTPAPAPPVVEMEKLQAELKKNVLGELSKAQIKRLSEITLQGAGFAAMLDDNVANKIGLSSDQLKKLRAAFKASADESRRIQEGALKPIQDKYKDEKEPTDPEVKKEMEAKIRAEVDEANKKVQPQLQAQQEKFIKALKSTVKAIQFNKFEALQGKPFIPK